MSQMIQPIRLVSFRTISVLPSSQICVLTLVSPNPRVREHIQRACTALGWTPESPEEQRSGPFPKTFTCSPRALDAPPTPAVHPVFPPQSSPAIPAPPQIQPPPLLRLARAAGQRALCHPPLPPLQHGAGCDRATPEPGVHGPACRKSQRYFRLSLSVRQGECSEPATATRSDDSKHVDQQHARTSDRGPSTKLPCSHQPALSVCCEASCFASCRASLQ